MFAALAVGSKIDAIWSRPCSSLVVRTQRLRYQAARPPSRRMPCTIPSPKNQCDGLPAFGFDPLRR